MAKKKKGKVIQMLSPENYIKQKARDLPVYECWVNKGWDKDQLAHVIVARKHVTGNITFGIYLVDLKCLGVKDAIYQFNVPHFEYLEHLEATNENMAINLEKISYVLAHNIIYAGIEFAEEYGFEPYKDFAVAKYILEEDNEDIEIIDIECGINGMPFYVRGPLDSELRANQLIDQLEKTAGPGNYEFVNATDYDFYDDDETGDDEDVFEEESDHDDLYDFIEQWPLEKKVVMLKSLMAEEDRAPDKTDALLLYILIQSIFNQHFEKDDLKESSSKLLKQLKAYEITPDLSDEVLGLNTINQFGLDRYIWQDQFLKIFHASSNEVKSMLAKLKKIRKTMPDNPAVHFLDLFINKSKNYQQYLKKINDSYTRFPDYSLIKILKISFSEATEYNSIMAEGPALFFSQRKQIHEIELFLYLTMLNQLAFYNNDFKQILVIEDIATEIDLSDNILELILKQNLQFKLQVILDLYYKENPHPDKRKTNSHSTVYQFRIQIKGIKKPPVWRQVIVPADFSFYEFHLLIQSVFGWDDSHLFEFSPRGIGSYPAITTNYGEDLEFDGETIEAEEMLLSELFEAEKQKIIYTYDFGDNWEHQITLEKILKNTMPYVDCIAGKGKCPPEDCGGIWGYERMKEVMTNKDDPEYNEFIEWLGLEEGAEWDANEFDLEEVKQGLRDQFQL